MEVSFDGLRKNATSSMNRLYDVLDDIMKNDDICNDNKIQIIEKFNDAAMFVDSFNCLYDDSVEDDMNNIPDLFIPKFDERRECIGCGELKTEDEFYQGDRMCLECHEEES